MLLPLLPGMLVQNRYRIVEKLGSGGFGEIFAVRDEKSCHKIKVLKVLNLDNFSASEKEKAIALFQREAQVLNQLNHPGIPKVQPQGYFTIENVQETIHCLVMEKIAGENLLTWLKQRDNQPISSLLAIDWLKQLLEILQELHQNHYFHRDIKPENIMLQPNGKLVLIDFGGVRQINNTYLGKLAEDKEHTTLISQQGYTPIEQMNGKALPQSDFFALGRTMVHLLTGIAPVNLPENETTVELIWRDRASEIPDKLADLLDEMMALFPRERPSSTQVILARLNDLESGDFGGKVIAAIPGIRPISFTFATVSRSPLSPLKKGGTGNQIKVPLVKGDLGGSLICMFSEFAIRLRNFNQHKGAIASVILLLTALTIGWHFASNHLAVEMNKRGISYHKNEEFTRSKNYYKIAIFLKSDYGQAYYNLGSLYEDQNDINSAIPEYDRAIKYNNPAAYNNLGRIYLLKQREPDCYRAAFLLLEGLEIATKDLVKYGLLTNLGRAKLCLEEHEKAQEYLETAIAINGDRPEAYCILAPVMDDLGDEYGTKEALAKCPIDSVRLPELDNWLKEKGRQQMLEQ